MTELLEQAFKRASELPDIEQNAWAKRLLDELESDKKWESLFADSEDVLERLANEALEAHKRGETTPLNTRRGSLVMNNEYTAVIRQEGVWWIGWIEEVPGVNCQERSHEELVETLRITLREALEFNRQDALGAAGPEFMEEKIAL